LQVRPARGCAVEGVQHACLLQRGRDWQPAQQQCRIRVASSSSSSSCQPGRGNGPCAAITVYEMMGEYCTRQIAVCRSSNRGLCRAVIVWGCFTRVPSSAACLWAACIPTSAPN
jgi:hypothetical protein